MVVVAAVDVPIQLCGASYVRIAFHGERRSRQQLQQQQASLLMTPSRDVFLPLRVPLRFRRCLVRFIHLVLRVIITGFGLFTRTQSFAVILEAVCFLLLLLLSVCLCYGCLFSAPVVCR